LGVAEHLDWQGHRACSASCRGTAGNWRRSPAKFACNDVDIVLLQCSEG
jgi:hypothetical protein